MPEVDVVATVGIKTIDAGAVKDAENIAEKAGKQVEIINTRKVKSTSPGEWHVAIDGKIKKIKNY